MGWESVSSPSAKCMKARCNNPAPSVHIVSFQDFLALFTVLPLTEDTMRHFARLRALLRKQGNLIPDLDHLIASTALEYELVLLTRNRRHFERVPDLRLYSSSFCRTTTDRPECANS